MKKTAQLTWVNNLEFVAKAGTNHGTVIDGMGDGGAGTSPMELVLQAVGGCSAMDVISILQKKRQQVKDFRIEVEAERGEEHPKVYTHIQLKYIVAGKNVSQKAVEDAVTLSMEKYCSVSAMIKPAVPIEYTIEVLEAD